MWFIFLFVIIVHAIRDAGIEAAVFTKDAIEDNDDLKTGPRFLKKGDAPATIYQLQPELWYDR